jgi:hypothetical protein
MKLTQTPQEDRAERTRVRADGADPRSAPRGWAYIDVPTGNIVMHKYIYWAFGTLFALVGITALLLVVILAVLP